ncbi:signal peptidase II [Rhizomicrobium palustre]|uniref:Lipoprotein signal peptidase n=1 Tax=Rhizomicrobium palustre TaxID=189966 RepID=A0A846N1N9_9PROT|nr:signal peptidase II [Rhizomicrobium palustre]NIK89067.1 signal peptidase II [Rhizomicrobium palustre]
MNKRDAGLLAAGATFVLDQASKMILLYGVGFMNAPRGYTIEVLPFFNLVMVWNPGISLGLFPASSVEGTMFLATFQMVAVGLLSWWLWFAKKPILAIGLGMVIGGALGNLIDRLVYSRVADFFHLHGFGYNFYVFNVADAAITFGVIGLLYDALTNPETPSGAGQKE